MDIYTFEDYRLVLAQLYNEEKRKKYFSCRSFAQKAGFSNPGFLNDVIKGKRKLSNDAVKKVIKVFSLSKSESEYFLLLVRFKHAKTSSEKSSLYQKMIARRNKSSFAKLNPALNKYYQDYRYSLIRSAIMIIDFYGDYAQIAKLLRPLIPANLVKTMVNELVQWNLVTINCKGKYEVSDNFVEPSPLLNEQVRITNRQWITLAQEAIHSVDKEKRHISSMLLSVSEQTKKEIFDKIKNFKQDLWNLVKNDTQKASEIMLVNIQYVPMVNEGTDQ